MSQIPHRLQERAMREIAKRRVGQWWARVSVPEGMDPQFVRRQLEVGAGFPFTNITFDRHNFVVKCPSPQLQSDLMRLDGAILREAERKMEEATGYKLKLKVKEFESLPLEEMETKMLAEGVSEKDYMEMRAEWEKNHFYFMESGCIVEINKDNTLSFMSLEMAKNNYGNKKGRRYGL